MESNNEAKVLMEKKSTKYSAIVKNIVSRFFLGNYLTKECQDVRKKALSDRKKEGKNEQERLY